MNLLNRSFLLQSFYYHSTYLSMA